MNEKLNSQYNDQINELSVNVDDFEADLKQWEVSMMDDLSSNKQCFDKFTDDVGNSLESMSKSVNSKYRMTTEYQEKVRQSMAKLEEKVYMAAPHE